MVNPLKYFPLKLKANDLENLACSMDNMIPLKLVQVMICIYLDLIYGKVTLVHYLFVQEYA